MNSKSIPDPSALPPDAEQLSHGWDDLDERPPEVIDELMIELADELESIQNAADEEGGASLSDILDTVAEEIIETELSADRDIEEEALERAIEALRRYEDL